MIVSVYNQPLAVIDLTQEDNEEGPDEVPDEMPKEVQLEWIVVDELQDQDLPEPQKFENEGDEMLFAFDHLLGNQDTESELSSESASESDYDDSDFITSKSEDSGVEI
jgi:hypothetical protein